MNIFTYKSDNAPNEKRWLAYLVINGDYMPVRFTAETEAEAMRLARAEWDKNEVERERNIAAREEGRRKAAETRAKKAAQS